MTLPRNTKNQNQQDVYVLNLKGISLYDWVLRLERGARARQEYKRLVLDARLWREQNGQKEPKPAKVDNHHHYTDC